MSNTIEISADHAPLILKLLTCHAKMNRQLIERERIDVSTLPGKRYLADAMVSDSAVISIEAQLRSDDDLDLSVRPTARYVGCPESDEWNQVGDVVVMAGGALDAEQHTLDPRHDLMNHSPTGFAWGYFGSGPAQLALAILAHATGDDDVAVRNYQRFKSVFIAPLGAGAWEITAIDVIEWLAGEAS